MSTPDELAKHFAAIFADPQARALILIERAKVMILDPPQAPRSSKREKSSEAAAKSKTIRAGLWAAKHPFLQDESVTPLVKKSLEEGNAAKVFEWLAKGATLAEEHAFPSLYARHVIIATRQAAHLMQRKNRLPTKAEIKDAAQAVFDSNGWRDFWTEPQRWTEIFNAAELSDMPEAG